MLFRQSKDESSRAYLDRFNAAAVEVFDLDQTIAVAAVVNGMRTSRLTYSLLKSTPNNLSELMEKAMNHIEAEEAMNVRKDMERGAQLSKKRSEPEGRSQEQRGNPTLRLKQVNVTGRSSTSRTLNQHFERYTDLNTSRAQILELEKSKGTLRRPVKMRTNPEKRDRAYFCDFHEDHGHTTEDCICLRDEIEEQVREGLLRKYAQDEKHWGGKDEHQLETPPRRDPELDIVGTVHVISGGLASEGESSRRV